MIERTLAIIKPDAVRHKHVGKIIAEMEADGFTVEDIKTVTLTSKEWGKFYKEHKGKDFFRELIEFMSNGTAVVLIIERYGAIQRWRKLMGATVPANAAANTIRGKFGSDTPANAVHGSDSQESYYEEAKFFQDLEY